MLINISGRTDIINYYSQWMFKRFEEGYVLSRNSLFPNSVRRYELTPEKVDCLLFGSQPISTTPSPPTARTLSRGSRTLTPVLTHSSLWLKSSAPSGWHGGTTPSC